MTDIRNQNPQPGGRRGFLGGALAGVAGGSLAALSGASAADAAAGQATRIGLVPEGVPRADSGYTPGILATGQRLIFVSGQGPDDLTVDMETQLRQTLENIRGVLEAAGAGLENVVMVRAFFVHLLRDLPIYRNIRKEYFVKPYPACTAVGTPELAIPGLEIEIEATAII